MTNSILNDIQRHTPLVGDVNNKSRISYQFTRKAITGFNALVMAGIETYLNGLKISDSLLKSLLNLSVQISYKYFPSLLVPYEWPLSETASLAEGSDELIKDLKTINRWYLNGTNYSKNLRNWLMNFDQN